MGSSTASALLRRRPDVEVILASRDPKSYDAAIKKRPELAKAPVLLQQKAAPFPSVQESPRLRAKVSLSLARGHMQLSLNADVNGQRLPLVTKRVKYRQPTLQHTDLEYIHL